MVDNAESLASTVSRGRSIRKRRIALWSCLCLTAAIGTGILYWARQEPIDRLLRQSRAALVKRDAVTAERLALRVLKRKPDSATALILAGRAATEQQRYQAALEYYGRVSPRDRVEAVIARCLAGDVLLNNLRRMTDAERQYHKAFSLAPESLMPNDRLAYLLTLETRAWEVIPYQLAALRNRAITLIRLRSLAIGENQYADADILQACHHAVPQDPAPLVSMTRIDIHERRFDLAKQRLQTAVQINAGLIEAQVKLGRLLLDHATENEFLNWQARLPDDTRRHPGIWSIFGYWAARHSQDQAAARCFWEAARRDPNRQKAIYQLGQLLISFKRTADAKPFVNRSRALRKYQLTADSTLLEQPGSQQSRSIWMSAARQAESLGLLWESWAWLTLLKQHGFANESVEIALARLDARLPTLSLTRAVPEANPAAKIDLSGYPLPTWPTASGTTPASGRAPISVTFEDRASEVGIQFSFFNSSDPAIHGLGRFYEANGGGTAILDFDGDGWPDIYFTQGCRWPPRPDRTDHLDRLFRNTGAGKFEDITIAAGLAENRYSQGVTVGDFNSDGFPDLYIANIGENRLYRNNGDGTFTDISQSAGIVGNRWTSSCLIADLNGDGLPDLYDVNYLFGRDLLTRICRNRSKVVAPCNPENFEAAQDRFYLNLGDGRFADHTKSAGFRVDNGKGLGILAADFDGSGRLSLFIANDGVPNFFFANQTAVHDGNPPQFVESAFPMGLAVNAQGQSEACMGIAAGDFNQDGMLDLFVTNFFNESNTLFLQQPDRLFRDTTTVSTLSRNSLSRLSFGTQAIDANLDGRLDLLITNGDIDVILNPGRDYQMPPQFFLNTGERFRELPAASLGRWFQGRYRGRGMSRLDWNRDGREDVVVSHLDGPAALVTNTTTPHGHFLAVRLHGIRSNRDAIGTVLTLKAGDLKSMRQLTAGDGYQASNERLILFGLGKRTQVDELTVRWPSGTAQTFSALSADEELILIEGRACPVRLPH